MIKGLPLFFSRVLTRILIVELNVLYNMVSNISLSLESDNMIWRMTQNDKFSTHEVYQWLMFRGITDNYADL
jgi:hypothetical protein